MGETQILFPFLEREMEAIRSRFFDYGPDRVVPDQAVSVTVGEFDAQSFCSSCR